MTPEFTSEVMTLPRFYPAELQEYFRYDGLMSFMFGDAGRILHAAWIGNVNDDGVATDDYGDCRVYAVSIPTDQEFNHDGPYIGWVHEDDAVRAKLVEL